MHTGVALFQANNKKMLGIISALFLGLVPWMQISKAVSANVSVAPSALLAVMAAGVAVHLVYLTLNIGAVNLLGLGGSGDGGEDKGLSIHVVTVLFICMLLWCSSNRFWFLFTCTYSAGLVWQVYCFVQP
jgi:hypothetical protein